MASIRALRRRTLIAASCLALVAATPLTGVAQGSEPAESPVVPPAVAASPQALLAPAVDGLDWRRCTTPGLPRATRCAWLTVPRDWADPQAGETYRIRVARIPATGTRIGVLTFNPGGPGGSGVGAIGGVASILPASVRQSFDLVAWDPRGVGESEPRLATCEITSPDLPATGPIDVDAIATATVAAISEANLACLAANPDDADYVGTWQVIRDLDALRAALGESKLTFWGMSYGTTVGRAYAQAFPGRLRALVLDGAISPAPTIHSYMREHIWDDVTAVERMLAALGAPRIATYHRAARYLEDQVLRFVGGYTINRWEFIGTLMGMAAYQQAWGDVGELLDEVRRALGNPRERTSERGDRIAGIVAEGQSPDPLVPQFSPLQSSTYDPLFAFVNCADMPDRPSAAAIAAAGLEAIGVGGTGYLIGVLGEGSACSGLPTIGTALPGLTEVIRAAPRPVVVNSVADNRTPYLGARALANAFASAPMVVYDGTQHVTYGRISGCVNAPVTRYLLTLRLPARSVACPLAYR